MATKFTATLPDGTVVKRTSQNRTYTHVIAISQTVADAREYSTAAVARVDSWDAETREDPFHAPYYARHKQILVDLEGKADDAPAGYEALGWAGSAELARARAATQKGRRFVAVVAVD